MRRSRTSSVCTGGVYASRFRSCWMHCCCKLAGGDGGLQRQQPDGADVQRGYFRGYPGRPYLGQVHTTLSLNAVILRREASGRGGNEDFDSFIYIPHTLLRGTTPVVAPIRIDRTRIPYSLVVLGYGRSLAHVIRIGSDQSRVCREGWLRYR